MKINCTIDGKKEILKVPPTQPLSHILMERQPSFSVSIHCKGAYCGNCIVNVNGNASLSCLVPAFKLEGAYIMTFEGFKKTRFYYDIENAYERKGIRPCPQCYASRTLILESILHKIEKENHYKVDSSVDRYSQLRLDKDYIYRELSLNACSCVNISELMGVIEIAHTLRSRRSVRRY